MSVAFSGIGVISAPMPLALWSLSRLYGVVELRSILFALIILVVLLVVAYLSNPSEASFRQFLTEQSFRHHISSLDVQDDSQEQTDSYLTLARRGFSSLLKKSSRNDDLSIPFHFSSRAAISVRTPKHIFRSFGVITFAAIVPSDRHRHDVKQPTSGGDFAGFSSIADSWFIGAFGKWWYAAPMDNWWKDWFSIVKDEEGAPTGVLDFKSLDRTDKRADSDLLKVSSQQYPALKLRARDRTPQSSDRAPRSSTPPPLPKSASLPLHAKRVPQIADQKQVGLHAHTPSAPVIPLPSECQLSRSSGNLVAVPSTATPLSRSPSASFDQSPVIAELLRQIGLAQSGVADLRGQLVDFRSTAAEAHQHLQRDLDAQRDRKKQDDTSRSELKTRTKNLEDAKRNAESTKRESEKKLKAAEIKRLSASTRIEQLDREIVTLQQRMVEDGAQVVKNGIETAAQQAEMSEEVEKRKKEIKVAEEVIAALSQRARELEEKIASETARLQKAQEDAEMRRQDRSFFPLHVITPNVNVWPPISGPTYEDPAMTLPSASPVDIEALSGPTVAAPSRPRSSSINSTHALVNPGLDGGFNLPTLISKGYSIFDKDIASVAQLTLPGPHKTSFSPFTEPTDAELQSTQALREGIISPVSSSLIPSSLYQSLEIGNKSRDHRGPLGLKHELNTMYGLEQSPVKEEDERRFEEINSDSGSPVSPTSPLDHEHDPFEVRPRPVDRRSFNMETQRAQFSSRAPSRDMPELMQQQSQAPGLRRWFSKGKNGLNPDAKAFSPPKLTGSRHVLGPALEIRNEHAHIHKGQDVGSQEKALDVTSNGGIMSSFSSPFFTSSHAFAPSPAEREVLTRALGGSKNTSLERLISLSEVGSLPASPSHVHSVATPGQSSATILPNQTTAAKFSSLMGESPGARQPLWGVNSLHPSSRPTNNFRPFADEEPSTQR